VKVVISWRKKVWAYHQTLSEGVLIDKCHWKSKVCEDKTTGLQFCAISYMSILYSNVTDYFHTKEMTYSSIIHNNYNIYIIIHCLLLLLLNMHKVHDMIINNTPTITTAVTTTMIIMLLSLEEAVEEKDKTVVENVHL